MQAGLVAVRHDRSSASRAAMNAAADARSPNCSSTRELRFSDGRLPLAPRLGRGALLLEAGGGDRGVKGRRYPAARRRTVRVPGGDGPCR